jgi:hypothetical protein
LRRNFLNSKVCLSFTIHSRYLSLSDFIEKIWGIQREHEGEEVHEEVLDHLHEKIGVLEGVVNELHAQQEEHEAESKPSPELGEVPMATTAIDERLTTVLLIIASSKRPDYLKKTLEYVKSYHPK